MADIHTLNTAYRIEKTSPLLSKLEDERVYSVIFNEVITPMEEEVTAFREGGGDIDDSPNDVLIKCRRVMMDFKYLRANKIARDTLNHVRYKTGIYKNREFDMSNLSSDPKGDELRLHQALCDAYTIFFHGEEE